MTIKDILYRIDCKSVKIAREIEPLFRPTVTQGVPDLYTFKAKPQFRKPVALELRKKVAQIIRKERKCLR